jgi:spermidine synthase
MPSAARAWLLPALLLGSGFSALVYQILWLRLLGLVFGVTVHAASTVLAAFMGGLAIGSMVSGRFADRVRVPLRWLGFVELMIAVSALATPWLLDALEALYRAAYPTVSAQPGVLTALRFVGSMATLLVPTAFMGATMPLALRAASDRTPSGTRISVLYAANTAGALVGTWLTGYYLVSSIGIGRSFQLAAAVNVVVGCAALFWPWPSPQAGSIPASAPENPSRAFPGMRADRYSVLVVAAASGFVGLALEVIWFRTLVMFLPATTYVFTIVLAIVLGSIAVGSAIIAPFLRQPGDWVARLGVLQAAIAITAVASLAAQAWTYSRGWRTSAVLQGSALTVLPTMLLMGAAFPVAVHCWLRDGDRRSAGVGKSVGRFYMTNLVGAIAGAVAAGFLLIPRLGIRSSLVVVSSVSLTSALVVLAVVARRRRSAIVWAVVAVSLFVAISSVLPDPVSAAIVRRYGGERLLWREEGVQTTVTVQQGETQRVLYLDGLHQTNDSAGMVAVHAQIGTLAMAIHNDPKDALVVGLGGGATAGSVARFSTANVDVVELSPGVVRGAEWFRHINGDVIRRPNVTLRVDDGRNYLLLTRKRYDVITADIIQPFHAGAGSLYSVEYFRLARRALRERGVMLQWIGQRTRSHYNLIARTFLEAFPHATAWAGGSLVVSSTEPLRLSRMGFERRLTDPAVGPVLRAAGLTSFDALLALYTAGPDELRRFVGDGPVLSDDRPLVEYFRSLPGGEDVDLTALRGDVRRHIVP